MKRQLSENQLDSLMRTLVSDAAAGDAVVNEIADSPAMWWGVQRQINGGKEAARSPWPPIAKYWRLLRVGVPVAAVLVISFFVMRSAVTVDDRANNVAPTQNDPVAVAPVVEAKNEILPVSDTSKANLDKTEPKITAMKAVFLAPAKKRVARSTTSAVTKTEFKTEFIALSYGRNLGRVQIGRVKVPSWMMVTLWLVSAVQRPTSMIDAEVVVGDDGMTHAIRFIR